MAGGIIHKPGYPQMRTTAVKAEFTGKSSTTRGEQLLGNFFRDFSCYPKP
jgi:hypothetical protein